MMGEIDAETNRLMNIMVRQQNLPITFRRICWPTPDRLCLLGRCNFCNDYPFQALGKIKHYIKHSPTDWKARLWDVFKTARAANFGDAQVWRGPWPQGVSRR
jgi:hypothetical protein